MKRELDSIPKSEFLALNQGKNLESPEEWKYCTPHRSYHLFGCPYCNERVLNGEGTILSFPAPPK